MISGLLAVDEFTGEGENISMRCCDLCGGSPVDDAPGPWRQYYYDPAEYLNVCEHCVESYLQEKP